MGNLTPCIRWTLACLLSTWVLGCAPKRPPSKVTPSTLKDLRNVSEAPDAIRKAAQAIVLLESEATGEKGAAIFVKPHGNLLVHTDSFGPLFCPRKGCTVSLGFEQQLGGKPRRQKVRLVPQGASPEHGLALYKVLEEVGEKPFAGPSAVELATPSKEKADPIWNWVGHPEILNIPGDLSGIPHFGPKKWGNGTVRGTLPSGSHQVTGAVAPGRQSFFAIDAQGALRGILQGQATPFDKDGNSAIIIPVEKFTEFLKVPSQLELFRDAPRNTAADIELYLQANTKDGAYRNAVLAECEKALGEPMATEWRSVKTLQACLAGAHFQGDEKERTFQWESALSNATKRLLENHDPFPYRPLTDRHQLGGFLQKNPQELNFQLAYWVLRFRPIPFPPYYRKNDPKSIDRMLINFEKSPGFSENYQWILPATLRMTEIYGEDKNPLITLEPPQRRWLFEKIAKDPKLTYFQRLLLERFEIGYSRQE